MKEALLWAALIAVFTVILVVSIATADNSEPHCVSSKTGVTCP